MSNVNPTGFFQQFISYFNHGGEKEGPASSKQTPSDTQLDTWREEAINELMERRNLSREVAESQIDSLS